MNWIILITKGFTRPAFAVRMATPTADGKLSQHFTAMPEKVIERGTRILCRTKTGAHEWARENVLPNGGEAEVYKQSDMRLADRMIEISKEAI